MILIGSCEKAISDAQKVAALKDVTVTYDSITYELVLPAGAGTGASFVDLILNDSSTYANPANYGVNFAIVATADNTNPGERDAKFDGLVIDMVMDTLESEPIHMVSDGFEVKAGVTETTSLDASINLETHRKSGLYIFQQVVDGEDLVVTLHPYLLYEIGTLSGDIPLPTVTKHIPTTASDETKAFLSGLLTSGLFDE
jgi:hypothetical protein